MEYAGENGDWFQLLMASPAEMRMLCQRAGLTLSEIIGPDEAGFYIGVIKKADC
jgi:hypothetical protein